MGILGFFFILIIVLFLFGATLLHGIVRWILNLIFKMLGLQNPQHETAHSTESRTSSRGHNRSSGKPGSRNKKQASTTPARKKIFGSDEGEYVDFEEIKD